MRTTKPKIISVRPERELCGVSYWAKHLESELRQLGADVAGFTYKQFLQASRDVEADGIVAHLEIGTDSKNGDVLRLISAFNRTGVRRAARTTVVHSVFTPEQLRLPRFLGRLAIAYQWWAYRAIARRSTIITLSEQTHQQLAERGIKNVGLTPGIYTSYLVERDTKNERPHTGQRFIGLIGHPYRSKQYHKAVEAVAALPPPEREGVCVVVLGGEASADPEGAQLLQQALQLLPPDQVVVTGPIEERQFSEWLDRLDIALMPYGDRTSSSAVFSRVVGHQIPAMVTRAPLFRPLVESGGAVATDDWPTHASDLLRDLLRTPAKLTQMREGAKALAEADSIQAVARRFLDTMGVAV